MKTRIFCQYPDQGEYLMNEINPTSRFRNTEWPKGLDSHTKEAQRAVAEDIVQGWKAHGNKPIGSKFRIVHSDDHENWEARRA